MFKKVFNIVACGLIFSLAIYYVFNNALRYFDLSFPGYNGNLKPFQYTLIIHIIGGILALLLGPIQFVNQIRRSWPKFHRATGKVYLAAIWISGPLAIYLGIAHVALINQLYSNGIGISSMGVAWVLTSAMAFWAIYNQNFIQHKEWMIRNYVITFGFVTIRIVIDLVMKNFTIDIKEALSIAAWGSWAIPLLVTEIVLQFPKVQKVRRVTHIETIVPVKQSAKV